MKSMLNTGRSRPASMALIICLLLALPLSLQLGSSLSWLRQWQLVWQGTDGSLAALLFLQSTLPRLVMALLIGASLGLSGCLMQQLTGNELASPMTLGAASGAWLALVAASVFLPTLLAQAQPWLALAGALFATLLVLAISGRQHLAGMHTVLAGLAMNMLFGGLASALVLLKDQYAVSLFIWGAGDLAQMDWSQIRWLGPQLLPVLLLLPCVLRPLQLLALGQDVAAARGLSVGPMLLLTLLLSMWLTALAVAAVGLIGFISLLAPILARRLGRLSIAGQWLASALLGALMLLLTDTVAQVLSQWATDSIPSGATAALIGAPALIWLLARPTHPTRPSSLLGPAPARRLARGHWLALWLTLAALALLGSTLNHDVSGWSLAWPDASIWWLRWPRLMTAASAGIALALAGLILQRLLHNPLASPELIGIAPGASLAMLLYSAACGLGIQQSGITVALLGALAALMLVLCIGHRLRYSPSSLILAGLALTALLDAVTQVVMARGDVNALALMAWLSGSTYRVGPTAALTLAGGVAVCLLLTLASHRVLALLSLGDSEAAGRGLSLRAARVSLLLLAALTSTLVTCLLGPIAFLAITLPHLAVRLGARHLLAQISLAAGLGASLMLLADGLSRTLIAPLQLPTGLCASVICGSLLVALLLSQRKGDT